MTGVQDVAARVLVAELAFLWPIGYLAWRLLAVPRMVAAGDDTPVSITDTSVANEADEDSQGGVRAGNMAFLVLTAICLGFFGLTTAGEIFEIAQAHVLWGLLVVVTAMGLLAMIGGVEWTHLQDNRYVDLLSDADEEASERSTRRYADVVKGLRIAGFVWLGLFLTLTLWLWWIGRGGGV